MTTFLITLFITFIILIGAAGLIQICKYRPRNGKHQLTGMCHRQGGTVCCSCSDLEKYKQSPGFLTSCGCEAPPRENGSVM